MVNEKMTQVTKKILEMLIRLFTIYLLIYGSYYLYNHYTGFAIQMIDFEKIRISLIVHSLIFFLVGVVLKVDMRMIFEIRKRTVKLNYVKIVAAVILVIILFILKYNVFMYISCILALLSGILFIESFEFE